MIFVKRFASPAGPSGAAAYVAALRKKALNWQRVTFFHVDEYGQHAAGS